MKKILVIFLLGFLSLTLQAQTNKKTSKHHNHQLNLKQSFSWINLNKDSKFYHELKQKNFSVKFFYFEIIAAELKDLHEDLYT